MRPGHRRDGPFVGTLPVLASTLFAMPAEAGELEGSTYAEFLRRKPEPQEPREPEKPRDEIVVTDDKVTVEPTPIDRIGSRDVLTQHDVDRIAPRNVNDIAQWLPGVSSRPYNGADDMAPSFAIRGLPDDGLTEYILVTVDGVPTNPMPYGWTAFSYFPLLPGQVVGAEILKGGFAVRNGPNTVGGILNFVTTPIPDEATTRVRTSFGTNDSYGMLVSHGDTVDGFGYLITAGFLGGDGFRDDGEFEAQSVDAKLRWDLGDGDWFGVHGNFFNQRQQRPGGLPLDLYEEDRFQNIRPENHHHGARGVLDFTLHQDDGGDDFTEYYAWFSSTSNAIIGSTPFFGATTYRENTYTQYFGAVGLRQERDLHFAGLDHELHWGVRVLEEYLPERKFVDRPIAGGPEAETLNNRSDYTALSAHVDDTIRPADGLSINAGVRAEYVPRAHTESALNDESFDDEFFALLPGAGVAYEIDEKVGVFASYQQSFRAPQVWGFGVATSTVDDDQSLDFESGEGMEVGVRWRPTDAVETTATAWRTVFDDVAWTIDSVYRNIGEVEANGVDLGARVDLGHVASTLDGVRVGAAVTFQDSEIADAVVPANDGNQTPFAWEEKLTWFVEYDAFDSWVANVNGYHVGESYADEANAEDPNANGTVGLNPSRTVWGAGLAKTFEMRNGARMRLALDVSNLFDAEWFLYSRIGGKLAGAPMQAFVTLDLSF